MTYATMAILVVLALTCCVIFFLEPPDPGSIDRATVKRIKFLCGSRQDCEVALRDISRGDWDTFYEFSYSVNQADVDKVLGNRSVRVSDLQRILVFKRDGQIVRKGYGDTGQGQPLASEIEFSGTWSHGWISFPANTKFKVVACNTNEGGKLGGPYGGTYYLLIPLPIRSAYLTQCDLPFG
jgi:hypothetical protein